jgi:serine/threonine protein kinase/protein involved in polysaccharide export with SLBB domain
MLLMTETCPKCGAELNVDNAAGGLCGRCLFERGIEFTSTLAVNLADGSTPGSPRFTAPDPVEVEADLLSFDVLELIGQGGMGAVYKAYQRNLDRTVAIKILPRQSAGGHEFAERFAREARALARLRHENIVMAYDYGLTDRYLYSVMEYVGGPNLREMLRGREAAASKLLSPTGRGWERGDSIEPSSDVDASPARPLPSAHPHGEGVRALAPQRALEIARDICAALQYAHDHGVVHRDIKPENVLLDESGRVKIADFGLAKLLQPDPRELALTHTRHFMGTLHYMAPEQCERPHETDHRADIYSVGVVLYEMLTGELPIGRFDPPSMRAALDPRIDEVVLRALEKDPARRYATAAEFGAAIQDELDAVAAGGHRLTRSMPAVASGGHRLTRSMPADNNSPPPWGEGGRGAKPQALKSSSFSNGGNRPRRGPLIAASLFGAVVLAWFGWQLLIKYQRDKDGTTTLTVEAKGGDDQVAIQQPALVADKSKEDSASKSARESGLIGPVQIEYLDGLDQIVIRGNPRDVERTIDVIKKIEAGANKPDDIKRALEDQGVKTDRRASSKQTDANEKIAQVFKLNYAKASGTIKLLQKVFSKGETRIEAEDRSNSIIAMADSDTLATIGELLKALDQPIPQQQQPGSVIRRSLPEMETHAKNLAGEIERAESELIKDEKELNRLSKLAADLINEGKHTTSTEFDRRRLTASIEALRKRKEELLGQHRALTSEIVSLKARYDAIDRGEYPEALIMDEIKDHPQLFELRQRIKEAEELYEAARSAAKSPSGPLVQRSSARLAKLREAEEQLKEQLRNVALMRLRWGPVESTPKAKGIVQGTQTSPGGQSKIISLENSRASEVYEAVRKLYPEGVDYYMGTDTQSNSLVATGDPEKVAKIEAVVRHLDASKRTDNKDDRAKDQIKIFMLRNSRAAEANEMLRKLYPNSDALRMTVDDRTNSLIVEGDREMLDEIEAILLRLDESNSAKSDTGPTKIQRIHKLRISVAGAHAQAPINDLYNIDLDGYVNLGAEYGKVKVIGLTADQAQTAILNKLRAILREPKVVLSIEAASSPTERPGTSKDRRSSAPVRIQAEGHALRISATGALTDAPIDRVYHLDLDGYVNLGAEYGKIKVAGLTADEAQAAVLAELRKVLRDPKVTLTIEGLHQAAARPPIRITAQIHRDDQMLRVPFTIEGKLAGGRARYTLVAKGPRIGRLEFNVTQAMGLSGYGAGPAAGSGEGLVTSSKGLSIPSGEIIEVFIEEKPSTPQARPVRVSNIVNLTWDVADADAQKATESRSELRKLHEQLKFVEQQLDSQIPNARDTLETKLLKRERDELQRQIIGLGRVIERVPQPAASDPLANHPELAQMRRRLGELNAKISQERFRQEGAKESAYLRALKNQSQRLQNDIWEREKALRPDQSHAAESPAEPQGE